MLRVECLFKLAGQGMEHDTLFEQAWDEHIECHALDKLTWSTSQRDYVRSIDRVEILAYDGDVLVGAIVLATDEDEVHVGRCAYIAFAYVLKPYRASRLGMRLYHNAIRITKIFGYPILAYTHRVADWRYLTTYRRV